MTSVARFLLLAAAVAAVLAATGADERLVSGSTNSVTLVDVSKSHGPDPEFLVERARRGRESTSLVVFGAGARVVADGVPWPVDLPDPPTDMASSTDVESGVAAALGILPVGGGRIELITDGAFSAAAFERARRACAERGVGLLVSPPLAEPREGIRLEAVSPARAVGNVVRVEIDVVSTARAVRRVTVGTVGGDAVVWKAEVPAKGRLRIGGDVPAAEGVPSIRCTVVDAGGADLLDERPWVDVPVERSARRVVAVLGGSRVAEALRDDDVDVRIVPDWRGLARAAEDVDACVVSDAQLSPADAPFAETVAAAVARSGCGLLAIGGPRAWREGGWAGTAFEAALPFDCGVAATDVRVAIDRSGSMDRDGRFAAAVGAVDALLRAVSASTRVYVLPFADTPGPDLSEGPITVDAFRARALAMLRRVVPSGGTRVAPAVRRAATPAPAGDSRAVLAIVSDFDDATLDDASVADELKRATAGFAVTALVLDPSRETLERARRVAATVVPVDRLEAGLLVSHLDDVGFRASPTASRNTDGTVGPTFSGRHRVAAKSGSRVLSTADDGAALVAVVDRGLGRVLGAAVPEPEPSVLREWVKQVVRVGERATWTAMVSDGRLDVVWPSGRVVGDPPFTIGPAGASGRGVRLDISGPGRLSSGTVSEISEGMLELRDARGAVSTGALVPPPPVEWRFAPRAWMGVETPAEGGRRPVFAILALLLAAAAVWKRA